MFHHFISPIQHTYTLIIVVNFIYTKKNHLKCNKIDNSESEYFSETLAAESLPHYQPASPEKDLSPTLQQPQHQHQKSSPTSSPYSSVDATNNYMNNNGQQYSTQSTMPNMPMQQNNMNGNKYQQQPLPVSYNTNGNLAPRTNNHVVQNASISSAGGGLSSSQQMQQQIQQKYYDQYENFTRNGNQNGMSQSSYNSPQKTAAYPSQQQQPAQMSNSYNQQMNYNNLYNHHGGQNGGGVGKISDYDPITDGPRNLPQTARPNQTLIYSSDRAASK